MRQYLFSAAAIALLSSPLLAQDGATTTASPEKCREVVAQYRSGVIEAARAARKPVDRDELIKGLISRARDCSAQFNMNTMSHAELSQLGALYVTADNIPAARQVFKRLITDTTLSTEHRAEATLLAMRAMQATYVPDSGVVWAANYVPIVDSFPGVLVQKYTARTLLIGWYMSYDIDDKLKLAVEEMRALAKQMTPEQQMQSASSISTIYGTLAALHGSNLHADSALMVLRSAVTDFPALSASLTPRLAPVIARYEMVGKPVPSLRADFWLNDSTTLKAGEPKLVVFTANWCHSCRSSYPTVEKLSAEYKPKGLTTILAVSLDGQFDGVQMQPVAEVEANRKYFIGKHEFTYPIAIQRDGDDPATSGARNVAAFNVGAFPQFVVVDKKGIVRAVLMGWDPYGNRERTLTAAIKQVMQ